MTHKLNPLPDPLAVLKFYPQFILYKLVPSVRTGKTDKLPLNPDTFSTADAHEPANWRDHATIAALVELCGPEYGVGFVFTAKDPFFFLDIDNCLQNDNTWSPIANDLISQLPGATIEVSQSRRGLHIFGMYQTLPSHRRKNIGLKLELYTKGRYAALTGLNMTGDVTVDCTEALHRIIDQYFSYEGGVCDKALDDWRDTPVPEWQGPEDDETLINKMLSFRSARATFGEGASVKDLWENNEDALSKAYPPQNNSDPYDRSSADAALSMHLAYWTGNNHERILRLMRKSNLVRGKWEKHRTYLVTTITNAVSKQAKTFRANAVSAPTYDDIISQFTMYGDKLTAEQTTHICKLIANATLSTPQRSEIVEQLKKYSPLNSKKEIEQAIIEQQGSHISGNHPELSQAVIEFMGKGNVIYGASYFWKWGNGVWRKSDDLIIRQFVQSVCNTLLKGEYKKATIDSVFDITKTALYLPEHEFNVYRDANIINVQNGELHYVNGVWTLYPHVREHYFTTQLPVSYDPTATAHRFEQFLKEIFNNDPDVLNKIQVLLEMIGYTMLPTCRFEKFIILTGEGANGKSVIMKIIEILIGKSNVCAVQLKQLDNRFQRAHLDGKLANLVTEIEEGGQIPDAQIKAIVSGEMTTAEYKNKPPFDFHPIVTCWFATNHLPHIRDFSEGTFRRAIILELNNRFDNERCDPYLMEKLAQECPGILNMALRALGEALNSGSLTVCNSSELAKLRWRLEADQVLQFVEDKCVRIPGFRTEVSVLFFAYKLWATNSGIKHTLSNINFGKRLEQLGFKQIKGTNGVRQRMGIMLNNYSQFAPQQNE